MSWEDRSGRIDHAGPDTLWSQVAADLRAEITSGTLPPGSRLPPEDALTEIYGVARVTIRRAVLELRRERLLTVTVGRGTFVARR